MRANVYVDGFNLYYGIRRWQGSRWLDLGALCSRLFPNDDIHRIRYFTARVKGKADPGHPHGFPDERGHLRVERVRP